MAVRAFKGHPTVQWKPGMRPSTYPHEAFKGEVFLSVGKETWVTWHGETLPTLVFTGALEVVR